MDSGSIEAGPWDRGFEFLLERMTQHVQLILYRIRDLEKNPHAPKTSEEHEFGPIKKRLSIWEGGEKERKKGGNFFSFIPPPFEAASASNHLQPLGIEV